MIELYVLGSGSSIPNFKRFSPAQYLKIEGKNILIDCGEVSNPITKIWSIYIKY